MVHELSILSMIWRSKRLKAKADNEIARSIRLQAGSSD